MDIWQISSSLLSDISAHCGNLLLPHYFLPLLLSVPSSILDFLSLSPSLSIAAHVWFPHPLVQQWSYKLYRNQTVEMLTPLVSGRKHGARTDPQSITHQQGKRKTWTKV